MEIIKTNVLETKIINNQLFYILEGTEEYGPEPVVQLVSIAKQLGYEDARKQTQRILKRNKALLKDNVFLTDLKIISRDNLVPSHKSSLKDYEIDVSTQFGYSHNSKKTKAQARKTQKTWVADEVGCLLFMTCCKTPIAILERKLMADRFVKMRKILLRLAIKQRNQAWIEYRQSGKTVRIDETDHIQEHIKDAEAQGSKNANRYYYHYSILVKKALNIENLTRDEMSEQQLIWVAKLEKEITFLLAKYKMRNLEYKEIYKKIKKNVHESAAYYLAAQPMECLCQK